MAGNGCLLAGVFGEEMTARPGGSGEEQLCMFDGLAPDQAEGGVWLGFTADHGEEDAARRFRERYGRPPGYIVESLGLLLVGPVPPVAEVQR